MPMSDKEQIQMVKDWWKEYGNSIVFALIAVVVINFSWHYWQKLKYERMARSSFAYTQLLNAIDLQKNEDVQLFAKKLIDNYPRTPYASLAAFTLAKEAVAKGDLNLALEKLKWVANRSPVDSFRQLASVRAGRILIAQKKPKEALDILNATKIDKVQDFAASVDEVKGDALMALGDTAGAQKAYQEALALARDIKSPLLKMKLEQF